jgi:CelD/BcsL family acetyltransferase involved in cellulose biosynthesis
MPPIGDRIRVVEGIDEVRAALADLPAEFAGSAFQTRGWLDCWLARRHAEPGHEGARTILAIAEDSADGTPRLALPLVLDSHGTIPAWAPLDCGVCDYNLPLTAAGFRPSPTEATRLWRAIVAALPAGASYLLLDKLPLHVGGRPTVFAALPEIGHSQVVRHPLPLGGDFETLRATRFSPTMVHSLDRKRRKLARKGALAFRVGTGAAALADFERLAVWRDERFGPHPEVNAFWRRLVERGDPARIFTLALDGETISACLAVVDAGGVRLLAVAHDARFNNWSPGLLVVEDAIGWALGEGFAEFDFTIGTEAYKLDFGVEPEPMGRLAVAFDAQGAAMLRIVSARAYVAARLRRHLDAHRFGGGHHRRLVAYG